MKRFIWTIFAAALIYTAYGFAMAAIDSISPESGEHYELTLPYTHDGGSIYVVRADNGILNIYSGDGDELMASTGIPTSALTAADRALFKKGLPLEDNRQLLMLLEDVDS